MAIFTGAGVAIVTPMNQDGSVNYEKLAELSDFQIDNGTDSHIICGTTGESPTLSDEEIAHQIDFCAFYEVFIEVTGTVLQIGLRLLSLPYFDAVQWVYGAGQPGRVHWMKTYEKILDAGKKMGTARRPFPTTIPPVRAEPGACFTYGKSASDPRRYRHTRRSSSAPPPSHGYTVPPGRRRGRRSPR